MKLLSPTLAFSLVLLLSSCVTIESPTYVSTSNFKVTRITPQLDYQMDVTMFNPNPAGVKIKELNMQVTVLGNTCNISTTDVVQIKSRENFTMPLKIFTSSFEAV